MKLCKMAEEWKFAQLFWRRLLIICSMPETKSYLARDQPSRGCGCSNQRSSSVLQCKLCSCLLVWSSPVEVVQFMRKIRNQAIRTNLNLSLVRLMKAEAIFCQYFIKMLITLLTSLRMLQMRRCCFSPGLFHSILSPHMETEKKNQKCGQESKPKAIDYMITG